MTHVFQVTFDYLCPFARNAAEAVQAGLDQGKDWKPTFRAFSLAQAHLEEGEPPVWERPDEPAGVLALQWGIAVRDAFPEQFPAFHQAMFAARHDHGRDIKDEAVIREAAGAAGLDPQAVAKEVASDGPLKIMAGEHTEGVERWEVFGVPTFIVGEEAVFCRLMERGRVDDVERLLDMVSWARLNEFKRTRIPR
ncbi:MAG: DsbA family protein [Acidimicrobiia bacterium]